MRDVSERLLQNTTAICNRHSNSLYSYYAILSSNSWPLALLEAMNFDNIAYNIIPFVSMSIA